MNLCGQDCGPRITTNVYLAIKMAAAQVAQSVLRLVTPESQRCDKIGSAGVRPRTTCQAADGAAESRSAHISQSPVRGVCTSSRCSVAAQPEPRCEVTAWLPAPPAEQHLIHVVSLSLLPLNKQHPNTQTQRSRRELITRLWLHLHGCSL